MQETTAHHHSMPMYTYIVQRASTTPLRASFLTAIRGLTVPLYTPE